MSDSAPENAMASRAWLAPALACAFAVVLLWPVFFGEGVWFLKDLEHWFYPSRMLLRERLAAGDLPLWNPQIGLGQPFLGNPANSVAYPLNALLLLPSPACVSQYLAAHVLIAILGAYALARGLAVSRAGAAACGLAFGLGGYVLSMTWSGTYLLSVAWIPLVTWLGVRVARRPGPGRTAAFALALGCQLLTGEVQAAGFSAIFLLALVLAEPIAWRARGIALGFLAGGAFLGLLLAMPQILPTLGVLGTSDRAGGIGLEEASHWSFHPLRFLELAVHDLQGTPLDASTYLGYHMNDEGGEVHRAPWMVSPYFGSLALGLAVVGLGFCRARWARAMAMVAAGFAVLALGRHTPVFEAFYDLAPGVDLFRYPAKYFAVVALALALLVGAGFDRVLADDARSLGRFLVGMAIGAAAIGIAAVVVQLAMDGQPRVTVRSALVSEALLIAAVVLALFLCRRRAPRLLAPLAAVALALQLAVANTAIAPSANPSLYSEPSFFAERAVSDAPPGEWPRVLIDPGLIRHGPGLDPSNPARAAFQQKEALIENVGAIFGLAYPMPYSATLDDAHREWIAATQDMQREALDLYGIRYLVLPASFRVKPALRFERLASVDDMRIALFRNQSARPFAYPASRVVAARSLEEARARVHTTEVTGALGAAIEGAERAAGTSGECAPYAKPRDEISLWCELDRAGWVIVNAAFHAGWSAKVDGYPAPVHRANAMVMAIPVDAGAHRVGLVYREPHLATGLWLAVIALALCLGLLAAEVLLRRRISRADGRRSP